MDFLANLFSGKRPKNMKEGLLSALFPIPAGRRALGNVIEAGRSAPDVLQAFGQQGFNPGAVKAGQAQYAQNNDPFLINEEERAMAFENPGLSAAKNEASMLTTLAGIFTGAGALPTAGKRILADIGLGAGGGFGESKSNDVGGLLRDAGVGAAFGGAVGAVGEAGNVLAKGIGRPKAELPDFTKENVKGGYKTRAKGFLRLVDMNELKGPENATKVATNALKAIDEAGAAAGEALPTRTTMEKAQAVEKGRQYWLNMLDKVSEDSGKAADINRIKGSLIEKVGKVKPSQLDGGYLSDLLSQIDNRLGEGAKPSDIGLFRSEVQEATRGVTTAKGANNKVINKLLFEALDDELKKVSPLSKDIISKKLAPIRAIEEGVFKGAQKNPDLLAVAGGDTNFGTGLIKGIMGSLDAGERIREGAGRAQMSNGIDPIIGALAGQLGGGAVSNTSTPTSLPEATTQDAQGYGQSSMMSGGNQGYRDPFAAQGDSQFADASTEDLMAMLSQIQGQEEAAMQAQAQQQESADWINQAIENGASPTQAISLAKAYGLLDTSGGQGGRNLPAGALQEQAYLDSAATQLQQLKAEIEKNKGSMGPGIGSLSALIPNSNAARLNSRLALIAQNVGKGLEGGKLTDADREYYRKEVAPSVNLTYEDALARIAMLEQDLMTKKNALNSAYSGGGYNLQGGGQEDLLSILAGQY